MPVPEILHQATQNIVLTPFGLSRSFPVLAPKILSLRSHFSSRHLEMVDHPKHLLKQVLLLLFPIKSQRDFPDGTVVKNLPTNAGDTEMQVQSLGWENPLE